jgi:hypothetical protein
VEEGKSVGDWSRTLSIPASADNDDGDFSLDNDASKANFAAELRLAIPACHFNMRSRASKRRTEASVESLLQDWHTGAKAAQRQFQKDAQLLVTLLNQQIPHASTLLQKLSSQTTAQVHLFDNKLAESDHRVDEKLVKVDKVLLPLGTSLSSIEDSITSVMQVLPTVDTVKGWVKDAVTSEQSAAPTKTAPTIPPHQTSCRTTMPSPCPPTMTGLAKLASDI